LQELFVGAAGNLAQKSHAVIVRGWPRGILSNHYSIPVLAQRRAH
jgi:hypothetical protein